MDIRLMSKNCFNSIQHQKPAGGNPSASSGQAARRSIEPTFLKAGWAFVHYREAFFQSDAHTTDCAFVEQAADERYTVRDAAWGGEGRDWILRVGRPIAAGLLHFDKSGA